MADNFDMKKFLVENKLGAYSKLKEDEGNPLGDFLYQYELDISGDVDDETKDQLYSLKTLDDVRKYYDQERGWLDDADFKSDFYSLIRTLKKKFPNLKEDIGGDIGDAEAAKMMDFLAEKEPVEEASQGSLMAIDRIEEIVSNLARNISTNSNIPTQEKIGLVQALKELKDLVEDLGADVEMGMSETKKPVKEGADVFADIVDDVIYGSDTTEDAIEYLKEIISFCQKKIADIESGDWELDETKKPVEEDKSSEVPFTDKVKRAIDRAVASAKKDGEFDELVSAGYFDEELVDDLIDLFPNKDYDSASKEVMNYIAKVTGQMSESKKPVEEDMYDIDAQSFGGILKSDNPEGDTLVLRFLKGIAKKFDYPVGQAAMFVKERIKKLGY